MNFGLRITICYNRTDVLVSWIRSAGSPLVTFNESCITVRTYVHTLNTLFNNETKFILGSKVNGCLNYRNRHLTIRSALN
jgi:hypothetical protein